MYTDVYMVREAKGYVNGDIKKTRLNTHYCTQFYICFTTPINITNSRHSNL